MKTFKQLKEEMDHVPQYTEADVDAVKNMLGLEFIPLKELLKQKEAERNPKQVCPCQLLKGLNVEAEHSDITYGDLLMTAKIALAHLKELPNYYDKLSKIENKDDKKK